MASDPNVMLHFKDVEVDEALRTWIERRCEALLDEFPEVTHLELSVAQDGLGLSASGRVTGKRTDLGTHATAPEPRPVVAGVLARLRHQLRRTHDKRIFAARRVARKSREGHRGRP